jgi:hypothetical protein
MPIGDPDSARQARAAAAAEEARRKALEAGQKTAAEAPAGAEAAKASAAASASEAAARGPVLPADHYTESSVETPDKSPPGAEKVAKASGEDFMKKLSGGKEGGGLAVLALVKSIVRGAKAAAGEAQSSGDAGLDAQARSLVPKEAEPREKLIIAPLEKNFLRIPEKLSQEEAKKRLHQMDNTVPRGPMSAEQMQQLEAEVRVFYQKGGFGELEVSKKRLADAVELGSTNENVKAAFKKVAEEYATGGLAEHAALESVLRAGAKDPDKALSALDALVSKAPSAAEGERRLAAGLQRMLEGGGHSEQDKARLLETLLRGSKSAAVRRQAESALDGHVHRLAQGDMSAAARFTAGTQHPKAHQTLSRALEARLAGAATDGPEVARLREGLERQLRDEGLAPEEKQRLVEGVLKNARMPAVLAAMAGAVGSSLKELAKPEVALSLALKGGADSAQAKALVQGMDKAISAQETLEDDKSALGSFEVKLQQFLGSERVPEEAKLALAKSVMAHSKNPNVRAATASAFANAIQAEKKALEPRRQELAAEVLREMPWDAPPPRDQAPAWLAQQRQKELERRFLAEARPKLGPYRQALGELLTGEHAKATDTGSKSHIGQLNAYLLNTRRGAAESFGAAQDVMRALLEPPSEEAVKQFAAIVQGLRLTKNDLDAKALGYFIEAGRQALEVDPKLETKRQREMLVSWGGAVMHVAVAYAAGKAGYQMAEKYITDELRKAAAQAAGCKAAEVTLDKIIEAGMLDDLLQHMKGKLGPDDLKTFRDTAWKSLKYSKPQEEFRDGVNAAKEDALEKRNGL